MLREQEEIVLYNNILQLDTTELPSIITFLKKEYTNEAKDFPYSAPIFNENAALWAAQTVYIAAQLMLYRASKPVELVELFPDFEGENTPAAILSADLYLRFLPDILIELKMIDSQDLLIEILEKILEKWHYSGVNYSLPMDKLNFDAVTSNLCVKQLYANRIITYKKIDLAKHPIFQPWIAANLGIFNNEFWKEFKH